MSDATSDNFWKPGSQIAQADCRSGYPVDILEEDTLGGHTFERHVAKTEQYLTARILGNRTNIPGLGEFGEKRAGSFMSVESANKLINAVIAEPQNQAKLKGFVAGEFLYMLPDLYLFPAAPFKSPTGYEMYAPNSRSRPKMRSTHSLEIRIRRTKASQKGYYINTAFPLNED